MSHPSLVIVKRFLYRDVNEEFSNRYHLDTEPDSSAAWLTLATVFANLEKTLFTSDVKITRYYGYHEDGVPSEWQHQLVAGSTEIAGTYSTVSGVNSPLPGDAAMTIRFWHGVTNSRGRKVYTRKYFHGVYGATDRDQVAGTQLTALTNFGTALQASPIAGTSNAYVDKDGNAVNGFRADPWVTTRTLKRRGKRPPTSP